jgi:hypothetical protein
MPGFGISGYVPTDAAIFGDISQLRGLLVDNILAGNQLAARQYVKAFAFQGQHGATAFSDFLLNSMSKIETHWHYSILKHNLAATQTQPFFDTGIQAINTALMTFDNLKGLKIPTDGRKTWQELNYCGVGDLISDCTKDIKDKLGKGQESDALISIAKLINQVKEQYACPEPACTVHEHISDELCSNLTSMMGMKAFNVDCDGTDLDTLAPLWT